MYMRDRIEIVRILSFGQGYRCYRFYQAPDMFWKTKAEFKR